MQNEAKTMNLFRDLLRKKGYYDDKDIIVEEQSSDNKKIQKLLKNASKSGLGKGFPDFIITSSKNVNLVIVVECKADIAKQKSATLDSFKDYAVDGALLYASFLAKEYDVIAIGFSGEEKGLTSLEHYIQICYTKELNEELHERKIKESKRALLISGILMALRNERFRAEYKNYDCTETLVNNLYASICSVLDASDVPDSNKNALKKGYDFITTRMEKSF